MPRGEHNERQTAFRLPGGLLEWLRAQAKAEDRTMTAIVRRALEEYRRQNQRDHPQAR